ncbi:capsular polysaccharide biosynthesis protein [Anaerosolibacter carboniphilus]|uniref:Capsular polysaccharide biosynthesis protein n=1 Tax=Anaerosolibacter carboniphilus TaxID=1417629 RepID=A0A841KRI9_9FIRM|nr:Wzz/FepE/Etk N-terminal domain-containing protein [Anaerosolibacter carboniphilus]MBB6216364.1 capsular polysaccharide biosynthesis protein [Anaerosolibacter carboniphilus]
MEEISVRELIEIMLKRKKMILVIPLIFVLISGILSFFVLSPTYEAVTTLAVSSIVPITNTNTPTTNVVMPGGEQVVDINEMMKYLDKSAERDISAMLNSLLKYNQMSIEAFVTQTENAQIMQKVIDELNLAEQGYGIRNLRDKIAVENTKGTNLVEIKVEDEDPKVAAKISNAISKHLIQFITEENSKQTKKLKKYIDELIALEEKKIDDLSHQIASLDLNASNYKSTKSRLDARLLVLNNTYQALIQKSEQLDLIDKADFGDSSITITAPAYEPRKPVSPNKILNIAIAFVLGLMISVFIAFFQEYWENSAPVKTEK